MTFVDISAMRPDFARNFTQLLSNKICTSVIEFRTIVSENDKFMLFQSRQLPISQRSERCLDRGSRLIASERASFLVMREEWNGDLEMDRVTTDARSDTVGSQRHVDSQALDEFRHRLVC